MVAISPINPFEPTNFSLSSFATPERYRIMAVLVMPNRNISIKVPDEIYKTHCPKISTGKVLAKSAKPAKPKNAMVRFPANDRKLASFVIFPKTFFMPISYTLCFEPNCMRTMLFVILRNLLRFLGKSPNTDSTTCNSTPLSSTTGS